MSDIKIHTAQNTILLQNNAGLGERMLATFVDLTVIALYFFLGAVILSVFSLKGSFWLLYLLPVYFYTLVQELIFHGQTLGKKIMKLRVVHCEGRSVPFWSYLLRWLLRIVDIWLFFGSIGAIAIILSAKGQRIGDLAANTIVVSLKNKSGFPDQLYGRAQGSDETVRFNQAALLSDSDIEIIREVLAFGKESGYYGKAASMITQTSNTMKKKLSLETEMKPVQFLEQLLNDYAVLFR